MSKGHKLLTADAHFIVIVQICAQAFYKDMNHSANGSTTQ